MRECQNCHKMYETQARNGKWCTVCKPKVVRKQKHDWHQATKGVKVCEDCATSFYGGQEAKYCEPCRSRRRSEFATMLNVERVKTKGSWTCPETAVYSLIRAMVKRCPGPGMCESCSVGFLCPKATFDFQSCGTA